MQMETVEDNLYNVGRAFDKFALQLDSPVNDYKATVTLNYSQLCANILNEIEPDNNGLNDTESQKYFSLFQVEQNTWRLFSNLQFQRQKVDESGMPDVTTKRFDLCTREGDLIKAFERTDREFAEITIVRQWLQSILPPFVPVEVIPHYWPYTLKDHQERVNIINNAVTELDPDAPHRQFKRLRQNDELHDKELNRSIYEYLRRGDIDNAMHLSHQNGHYWRAASIVGWCPHVNETINDDDPMAQLDIPQTGNIAKRLWRATCFRLAREPNLDKCERAIYATLCGDSKNVLPLCTTWEDFVWSYYIELAERLQEKHLTWFPPRGPIVDEGLQIEYETRDLKVADIFERAEAHLREINPVSINDTIHVIFHEVQKYFILDQYDRIIPYLRSKIENTYIDNIYDAHILRFSTHLVLYIGDIMELPQTIRDDFDFIIEKYVELLISYKKHDFILTYLTKLPKERTIELYARFLKTLDLTREQRKDYIDKADTHGLNTIQLILRTVAIAFEEAKAKESQIPEDLNTKLSSLDDPLDPLDQFQIATLEWLVFLPYEKEAMLDALGQFNDLSRRLLASGKVNGMAKISELVQNFQGLSFLLCQSTETEERIFEFISYQMILKFFATHQQFLDIWQHKPSDTEVSPFDEWGFEIVRQTLAVEETFQELLMTKFAQRNLGGIEPNLYQHLRSIYIPEIVFRLHQMLLETSHTVPANLEKSISLVDYVSDERYRFYEDLRRRKKLEPFLVMIRESSRNSWL